MPSEKYLPAICRSPLIDYLAGIGSHAVMILTFRHSGEDCARCPVVTLPA